MKVNIADLHPTQLYLSEKKLQNIQMLYQSAETNQVDPISILVCGDYLLITDGHHRAYQALLAGRDTISAEFDREAVMNYIISMRKLVRKERFTLFWI